MHKTIISDTSCFIILTNIGELDLLYKVYGKIITTTDIANEYGDKLPEWVEIKEVKDKFRQQILEIQIDKGESSAISLALEIPDSTLVLDDYKARRVAEQLGLSYTGTVGILVKAKRMGLVPAVKPVLERIRKTDFRISFEVELRALKEAGEL